VLELIVSDNFAASLDAMTDFYANQRYLYPEAGSRLVAFIDALDQEIVPLLARQPGIGRLIELKVPASDLASLKVLLGKNRGQRFILRQWFYGPFALKYAYDSERLVLLSAKHQSQRDYL
jgi:hypothetical protein